MRVPRAPTPVTVGRVQRLPTGRPVGTCCTETSGPGWSAAEVTSHEANEQPDPLACRPRVATAPPVLVDLDRDGLVSHLTAVGDGTLLDDAALLALAGQALER